MFYYCFAWYGRYSAAFGLFEQMEAWDGALASGIPVFSWLGPVVLLVSALLTAGYLLPVGMKAFFPGEEWEKAHGGDSKITVSLWMVVPVTVLAGLTLLLGLFSGSLTSYIAGLAGRLM